MADAVIKANTPAPKPPKSTLKKWSGRVGKFFVWLTAIIILLLILIAWLLQIPAVQNFARSKTVEYLETKLGTPVSIAGLSISFPRSVTLEGVHFEDQSGDSLITGGSLRVDIGMFQLLRNRIAIHEIWLQDIALNLTRDTTGLFNFEYIVKAFDSESDKDTTPTAPLAMMVDRLKLDRVQVKYRDAYEGFDAVIRLEQLRTNFTKFDPYNQEFHIPAISLNGAFIRLNERTVIVKKVPLDLKAKAELPPESSTLPDIRLGKVDLLDIDMIWQSETDNLNMVVKTGTLSGTIEKMDLPNQYIDIKKLSLFNTLFTWSAGNATAAAPTPADTDDANESLPDSSAAGWTIKAGSLLMGNNRVVYDDMTSPKLSKGMDYSHLDLQGISLEGTQIYFSVDSMSGNLRHASLADHSGFVLEKLKTDFVYTNTGASLKNLEFKTPDSYLAKHILVSYPSLDAIASNPGQMFLDAELTNTILSHRDILLLAPQMYENAAFAQDPRGLIRANGKITGRLDNLRFDQVQLSAFGGTRIRLNGTLSGLPSIDNLNSNLQLTEFTTTAADIKRLVPKDMLPDNIELPALMTLSGSLRGNAEKTMIADLRLSSSFGNANIKGTMSNIAYARNAGYDVNAQLVNFDLGKLLRQSENVGKVTMKLNAKGKGYDPKNTEVVAAATIEEAMVRGYTYHNLQMDVSGSEGVYRIVSAMRDAALNFDLSASVNLNDSLPAILADLALKQADLQQLGFSEVPFALNGNLMAVFPKMDIDAPVGTLLFTNWVTTYDTSMYQIDSMALIANASPSGNSLRLQSSFAKAHLQGKYSLTGLGTELIQYISRYYNLSETAPALRSDQQATLSVTLLQSPKWEQLLPGFELRGPFQFDLEFDSKLSIFSAVGKVPPLSYNSQTISGGSFNLAANDSALAYKFYVNHYNNNDLFDIPTVLVQGDIIQNIIYLDTRLLDATGRLQYTLAASLKHIPQGYVLHFDPKSVTIDYDPWQLDPGNELMIADNGIMATDFTFSNGSQAIIMQTFGDNPGDPLGIRLFNFEIGTLTGIARQDSLYLNGVINGNVEIQLSTPYPQFVADLTVTDLRYQNDSLGTLTLNVKNEKEDTYSVNASVSGFDNTMTAYGNYFSNNGSFDITLDVEKLNLNTLEAFTLGYVRQMTGHVEGGISISGNTDKLQVIGNVLFRDAEATIPMLNSRFSLRNERIRFLNDGMHFNDFTLRDATGNTAVLNGAMLTSDWYNYRFNMDLVANNFRLINSTRADNALFYGTLFMDTRLRFGGTALRPSINAYFKANDKTDMTFVMPQEDPEIAAREGVVEFFDPNSPDYDSLLYVRYDSLAHTGITGYNIAMDIEIVPKAAFSFVIDEANGDMISDAKGAAYLSGGIDPSGKITLTGTYQLDEGAYELSFNVLKRRFLVEKGSTITWTGEPLSANINLTALYKTRTAPLDLVEPLIANAGAAVIARYRNVQPFEVQLTMQGDMMKPDISFDIIMDATLANTTADVTSTVTTRLEQLRLEPSEMNKQVFALILLNRFVADNPFASGSGGTNVSSMAKQSVSKLLADQLNRLAGDLIGGVDLNFGVESEKDFTYGNGADRTTVNVGVSKNLLSDRLKVSIGSNFELEGPTRPNQKTSNIAGNVQVDYLLSKDGRYILRAFRRDQYQVALQGQVIETGVTFIINLEFDRFMDIMQQARERKIVRKNKEAEKVEE